MCDTDRETNVETNGQSTELDPRLIEIIHALGESGFLGKLGVTEDELIKHAEMDIKRNSCDQQKSQRKDLT